MMSKKIVSSLGRIFTNLSRWRKDPDRHIRMPSLIIWNLTNMCNLNCKHCYQDARSSPSQDELALEEKLALVDRLANSGVKICLLSGGEPLIHPDFFPVLEKMVSVGMYTAVASNGINITREVAMRLRKTGLNYIEISLDSVNSEKHDDFRGATGAWHRAVEGIKRCVEAGIFTAVATVFTRDTMNEVEEMLDLTTSLGAQRFIHLNFVPTGRGSRIADQDLTPWEREEVLMRLFRRRRTAGIEVLSTAPQYARVCIERSLGIESDPNYVYLESLAGGFSHRFGEVSTYFKIRVRDDESISTRAIKGCGAGRMLCCIQPNGDITPCMFLPQWIVGNLREESLEDIWGRMVTQSCFSDRESLEDNCRRCSFRYVCGGCRARAINYLGRPMGPDPGCIYNLEVWERYGRRVNLSR